MLRALALVATLTISSAGCTDDGSHDGDETAPSFTAAFDCTGLADRWATIQQSYLDRLGDADAAELDSGSARVDAAAAWFGPAMIEQVRDARNVGCSDEFEAGSALLCARLGQLEPGGEAAAAVVDDLTSTCESE